MFEGGTSSANVWWPHYPTNATANAPPPTTEPDRLPTPPATAPTSDTNPGAQQPGTHPRIAIHSSDHDSVLDSTAVVHHGRHADFQTHHGITPLLSQTAARPPTGSHTLAEPTEAAGVSRANPAIDLLDATASRSHRPDAHIQVGGSDCHVRPARGPDRVAAVGQACLWEPRRPCRLPWSRSAQRRLPHVGSHG